MQFFVPRKNIRGTFFFFDESESYHLFKVLRKKVGDILQIFDGEGLVAQAAITNDSNSKAIAGQILSFPLRAGISDVSEGDAPKENEADIRVLKIYPAIIKGARFEWMLEKVTELGVHSIQPLFTKRTLIQIKLQQMDFKVKRWEKVVLSAAKQSGRRDLPKVSPPAPFERAIKEVDNNDLNLILWEGEDKNYLSKLLQNSKRSSINLFIGPEGGFTVQEVNEAKKAGLESVRLGDNILRAETAAVAASSLILLGFQAF